jgi:glycosyltransferase involved in cell wall biosynthesis
MKTTLLVPTINEIDGMKAIMPQVRPEWVDQILLLDGGSTDGTVEYARAQGYDVVVQKVKGLRQGYMEALPHVKGDVIITFSPDGNSVAECIPPLVAKMKEGYDMVIVSRYLAGAKSEDDDIVTAFGNWMFTSLIRLVFGYPYTDAMVIYRAYRKDLVHELGLHEESAYRWAEKLFFTRISWEPVLSMRAAKRRLRLAEIPGDEPPRLGGVRKLQIIRWGSAFLFQIVQNWLFWK